MSVAGSTAVALMSLWMNYLNGKRQREHEHRLAYEERAWERKVDALFDVVATAREALTILAMPRPWKDGRALKISEIPFELEARAAVIDAYASERCRSALAIVLNGLRREVILGDGFALECARSAHDEKEAAIEAHDFAAAAHARERELEALAAWDAETRIDADVTDALHELIGAARDSVRGSA